MVCQQESIVTLEEFAAEVSRDPPNVYTVERGSHADGFAAACRDLGLEMRRSDPKETGFYRNGRLIGEMRGMVPDLTSDQAVALCKDKTRTLDLLKAAGVPVPQSSYFPPETGFEAALRHWAASEGARIVVKPSDSYGGEGITVGVPDAAAFRQAWDLARANLSDPALPIILEERIDGLDVRAIVVEGRFVCAATRVQSHVIGDGHSTVAELAARKNELRRKNPYHNNYALRVAGQGDAIPAAGQVWLLTTRANIHQGGESVDVTDRLPAALRRIAEQAAQAIPGLGVAGVDLIADFEAGTGRVIELNTSCNFCVHTYPVHGTPRNPARAVLDNMVARADRGVVYRPRRPKGPVARLRRRLRRLFGAG